MADKKLHLAAFVSAGPVSGSHAGWRHPEADGDLLSAAYYQNIGRLLEQGRFDLLFIADILAIPDTLGGSLDSQLRYGALGALRLDPMVVLSLMAGTTSHLGLAATVSTSYFEPFTVARAFATLDHLSAGRAAWNIVTSFQKAEANNFGKVEQLSHDERYDRAEEFIDVVCRLWDSWKDDALKLDPVTPLFADPARVQPINHKGKWFNVQGPLNVSRSPQGRPVFIQAGASDRGRDFAARWAEIIFVTHASMESAQKFYQDIKSRAEKFGRNPDDVKILPGFVPVIGETKEIAAKKRELLDALADPKAGLSTLAYHLDIDLAQFPQDEILPTMDVPGVHGHYKEVSEMTQKRKLTLSQVGKQYGIGPLREFSGDGKEVADRMQEWFEAKACDGFMVQDSYVPGGFEDFTRLVTPELQNRGLFRREYEGATLRENLGLTRPSDDFGS